MKSFSLWHLLILAAVGYLIFRWLRRQQSAKQDSPGSAAPGMTAREAELMVNAYGKVLEHLGPIPGSTVADESKLPFPKERIKAALLLALKGASSSEQRAVLKNGFLFLADFQPGVGKKDVGLDLSGVDVRKLDDAALLELAKNISGPSDGREEWLSRARAERETLERELRAAGL